MPDRSPRRILPVPGLLDIDSVEDANVAEILGKTVAKADEPEGDDPDEAPADPLSPPAPPALGDDEDEAPDTTDESADAADPWGVDDLDPGDVAEIEAEADGEAMDAPPREPDETTPEEDVTDPETPRAPEPAPPQGPGEPPTTPPGDDPGEPMPPSEPGDPAADADRQPDEPGLTMPPPEVVETAREATRSGGRELVQLVMRYGKAHVPETPEKAPVPDAGPPRMVGRIGQILPVLAVIPWGLAALFALSFWWDFDGRAVVLFGETFSAEGLLRVLTVSGLIGFGTNWLAITMLFQPREKRAIIPQGLIPAQRERVIYRLSEAISRELINADIIKQKIKDSGVIGRYRDLALGVVRGVVEDAGFRTELKTLAQDYATQVLGSESVRREVARLAVEKVEQQAGQGLGGMALRLYRTFAEDDFQRRLDRALDELPGAVAPLLDRIDTALDAVPAKVEARADEIEETATRAVLSFVESFDVRAMISDRARQFDEGQLEGLLKSTSNEQLNYIKYLGGILGVFGGFVIWQPLASLVLFVTIGLALWGVDEALVRARRAREGA